MVAMRSPEGFDAVYLELFGLANSLACSVVGDGAEAEDIAAETMARALASWGRVRDHARPWVLRSTTNLCLRSLRRQRRRGNRRALGGPAPTVNDNGHGGEAPEAIAGSVQSQVGAGLSRENLVESLRHLPRRQAQAVVLRYFAGSTDEDISEVLGLSPPQVTDQLKRALSSMRRRLPAQAWEEDEGEVGIGTAGAS